MNVIEAVDLCKRVEDARDEGFIGFFSQGVMMDASAFLWRFEDFDTRVRSCDDYPHEVYTNVNGIKFYAIMSDDEYSGLMGGNYK